METVTSTQAIVSYSWGNFKHDPRQVLLQYFDVHLYSSPEKFFPSSKILKRRRSFVKFKYSVQALDFFAHHASQCSGFLLNFFQDFFEVGFQVSQRFPAAI
ncbi:MAG: hypothetical protein Q8L87_19615, partial [Anaerolineales bacterium]|nr:hypothetical protein [Anaerolineales bacterium]